MKPDPGGPGAQRRDPQVHRAGVRDTYDGLADAYDQRWSGYIEATIRRNLHLIPLRPGARLLDVGCGSGALLERLRVAEPEARLLGIDLSTGMLAAARARLDRDASIVQADVSAIPLATGSADVIVSLSSLHYWADPGLALDELARVLLPGGRLVLADWCRDFTTVRLTDLYLRFRQKGYQRALRERELRRLLEERGFTVETCRYRVSRWWGMMTAVAARGA